MKPSIDGMKPLKQPPVIPWDPETMSWKPATDDRDTAICGPADIITKGARIEVMAGHIVRIVNVGHPFPNRRHNGRPYVYGYPGDIRTARPSVQRQKKREWGNRKREAEGKRPKRRFLGGMGL